MPRTLPMTSAMLALAVAFPAGIACAQETASTIAAPVPSAAETTDPAKAQGSAAPAAWSATLSAGGSIRDSGPDGSWQSAALERSVGQGYVRAGVMRYHGTLVQSNADLPSDYYVGTLGAGGNFSGWVVDGWASYGKQDYGKITDFSGTRRSNGARSSDYYALGGDFGRVLSLAHNLYLTPTVATSYAFGKLLRPGQTASQSPDLETSEPTWSANAAIRLDRAFGASRQNYAGLTLSRNWTSNGVSTVDVLQTDDSGAVVGIDSRHRSDQWTEIGATASLALTPRLRMDIAATQGLGVRAGNFTNLGLSLRRSF